MRSRTGRELFSAPLHKANGKQSITRVLIGNRGEIACRIINTCEVLGIIPIAVYADADEQSLHVKRASIAHYLGPADQQPYQNGKLLIEIGKKLGADAIHPGYGYLSENDEFARAVNEAGMVFVGPTPESIAALGDKREAKAFLQEKSAVPLIPGYNGMNQDSNFLVKQADEIGYPVMIKASAGGGGKGMRIVYKREDFKEAFTRCASEAKRSFGSSHCLIEKYIEAGKHVEIQIFGDGETTIRLGDRDCSIQRRHQKVVEESPCSWMGEAMRTRMVNAALEIAQLLKYKSAGTVEFIVDILAEKFYFLEVNTRIQVEHPITEETIGVDIVSLQLWVAGGGKISDLPELSNLKRAGHAIEVRLCAEDSFNNFLPCIGTIQFWKGVSEATGSNVSGVRYDSGIETGSEISVFFDSMISKVIVWAHDRSSAIQKLIYVLRNTVCLGITTNQLFLESVLSHPSFQRPDYTTAFIDKYKDDLLKPLDTKPPLSTLAIAASVAHQLIEKESVTSTATAFSTIPSRFRNQHKDKQSVLIKYLSCDLKTLGYPTVAGVMVGTSKAGEYNVWKVPVEKAPTAMEEKAYINNIGGGLVKRYYAALNGLQVETAKNVRVLGYSTRQRANGLDCDIRISINDTALNYFVAIGALDGLEKTIYVRCPDEGTQSSYVIANKLTWAGKLNERASGGLGAASADKYVTPMPGKVLQVLAKDGTTVAAGDGLLIMESMKTEIRMNAHTGGKVKLHVKQGDLINEGTVLCEVVEEEAAE
ncbi:hypothetical protein EG329_004599 [Mollisiaceae sp. DMI_Dod_QoI]|nr:hypothetical protein EG329_004599 [Helotiales sp. DMI_Dod_QoI]